MYREDIAPEWFKNWMPADYPIEFFDPDKIYSVDTVFFYDMYGGVWEELIETFLERGHKVIYDAKNEHYVHVSRQWILDIFLKYPGQGMFLISGDAPMLIPGVTVQATPYWYWIMDQGNFRHFKLNQFQPSPDYRYKFFMTMSLQRPERDYLYNAVASELPNALYSYRAHGKYLANDIDNAQWQRYVDPAWINNTCFTLAVETYINDCQTSGYKLTENNNWFLCEKTYKPLATQHPFILASTQGNLSYVRQQGFETFPELWDESYDNIVDWQERIQCIVEIIQQIDIKSFNITSVQEKLKHNQARFFNMELVTQLCNETVIQPILEFAND